MRFQISPDPTAGLSWFAETLGAHTVPLGMFILFLIAAVGILWRAHAKATEARIGDHRAYHKSYTEVVGANASAQHDVANAISILSERVRDLERAQMANQTRDGAR